MQPEPPPRTEAEAARAEERAALLELERGLQAYRFEVAACTDHTALAAYAGRRDLRDGSGGDSGGSGGGDSGGSGGAIVPGCRHACNHACRPVSAPPSRTARAADLVRWRQAAAGAFEREHKRRGLAGVKAALALHWLGLGLGLGFGLGFGLGLGLRLRCGSVTLTLTLTLTLP